MISLGDLLPDATFKCMTTQGPEDLDTKAIFGGKKVILFAVPGAFTPTCSKTHLPGFVDKAEHLKALGYEIYCVAVNDVFVMDAWGKSLGVDGKVTMLADGNGNFTKAVGLETDLSMFGLGLRSKRYAMVVADCQVKLLSVEQGAGVTCSGADSIHEAILGGI